jgi:gliding motility-associated-like protein
MNYLYSTHNNAMKKLSHFLTPSFILLALTLMPAKLQAQIVGANAFLQGSVVEIGVNTCGAYGSNVLPPTGYHPTEFAGLGFVADSDLDGWDVGTPDYCGDYFVPGSPVEGWQIQIDGTTWTNTDQSCFTSEVPGDVVSYDYTSGIYTVVWEGEVGSEDLGITQKTILPEDAGFFVTKLIFCNNGVSPLEDIYYNRNVDPDNDQPWSGDFTTDNLIVFQPPADDKALVTSEGLTYGCYLGIGALDTNARVSYGNFATTAGDPDDVWFATGGYSGSGSSVGDIANSIAFYVGDLDPGECVCKAFAYILNEDDLEEALALTGSYQLFADNLEISEVSEVNTCQGDTIHFEITNGDEYDWTWTPGTFLDTDEGTTVVCIPGDTVIYYLTGTSECGTVYDTITVNAYTIEGTANAGPDTVICPGDTINLQGSGGFTYEWVPPVYLADVSDPNTELQAPLTDTYYFLIAYNELGCSDTDMVYIDLLPVPDIDAGQDKVMILGGFTQLIADGGVTYEWTPAESLSNPLVYNPIASPEDTTVYYLTGYDEFGCVGYDSVTVFGQDPVYIVSPNAFTPNGDDLNDFFRPVIIGPGTLLDFQVFNRWGEMVYQWNGVDRGWDGYFAGKEAEIGTYLINVRALDDLTGKELTDVGSVVLMR